MKNGCDKAKLGVCCFGVAIGVTKGLYMMLFAWASYFFGYGSSIISEVGGMYSGYSASIMGGVIGAGWGFLMGFVFGVIAAYIYNRCLCYCYRKSCSSEE